MQSTSFNKAMAWDIEQQDDGQVNEMTMVGTLIYCAPEITRGDRYDESVVS